MKKISPSMMCANIMQLSPILHIFEQEHIELLHVDVMDGLFVPNFALGIDYIGQIRQATNIPLDIHLMVCDVDQKLPWLKPQPNERIAVHYECCRHPQRVLEYIRNCGAEAVLALSPATRPEVAEYLLPDIDSILLMTVNPGFAGQKLIKTALQKISDTRQMLDKHGYHTISIEVDGNVSYDAAPLMSQSGADIFVAGSSSFFNDIAALTQGIKHFREIISV